MKKALVTLLLAVAALSANAVPLFANFVDLCPKWTELQLLFQQDILAGKI